jgi:hypothetical protein
MEEGANDFVNFLLGFYNKYPEFKQRPLILAG